MNRIAGLGVMVVFIIFMTWMLDQLLERGGVHALMAPLVFFGGLALFFGWAAWVKRSVHLAAHMRQFALRSHAPHPAEEITDADVQQITLVGIDAKDYSVLSLNLVPENEAPRIIVFALGVGRQKVTYGDVRPARRVPAIARQTQVQSGTLASANFMEPAR